jgi:hypothetical protein
MTAKTNKYTARTRAALANLRDVSADDAERLDYLRRRRVNLRSALLGYGDETPTQVLASIAAYALDWLEQERGIDGEDSENEESAVR